jgi:hypothetical protein
MVHSTDYGTTVGIFSVSAPPGVKKRAIAQEGYPPEKDAVSFARQVPDKALPQPTGRLFYRESSGPRATGHMRWAIVFTVDSGTR